MRRRWISLLLLFGIACGVPARAQAQVQGGPSEQALRAAMVFNFLKFADLPATTDLSQLRLCLGVGDAEQARALLALTGRPVRGRSLVVSRLPERGGDCHVLYVDSRQHWVAALEILPLSRTLTIGGYPGFARDGGMIEIRPQEGTLRFDINLAESRRAGMGISPQLLRLARHVAE